MLAELVTTGVRYALKIYPLDGDALQNQQNIEAFTRERDILLEIHHPNIAGIPGDLD